MIKLIDLLAACGITLPTRDYKIHLATPSRNDPLEEFFNGRFKEWQEWQTRKNFECAQVISLIRLSTGNWLFAGVYEIIGREIKGPKHVAYDTRLLPGQDDLIGRVVIEHRRKGRQAYIFDHDNGSGFLVTEIRREKMVIQDFPGFNAVCINHTRLQTIIRQKVRSWHGALANIKGVYLISDLSNGKTYVGSATGGDGIWDRWQSYAKNGHGGNAELRAVMKADPDHCRHFQYSILEIADTHASDDTILQRESHWKDVLLSRPYGYNRN